MREGPGILKPQEHHIQGAKPIIACVGSFEDFGPLERLSLEGNFSDQLDGIDNVDYNAPVAALNKRGFLNGGHQTYVISSIDDFKKFSHGFYDCTGLVVVGTDGETGKNISFLTHQDPKQIFRKGSRFTGDLKEQLKEIGKRCVPGTVDAVVVGGNYFEGQTITSEFSYRDNYLLSIELLSKEVKKEFGFEPEVINGPKATNGPDSVFFDSDERRLYLLRPKVNTQTGSFPPSRAAEAEKGWNKDSGM